MSKKGATCSVFKVVGKVKSGAGGKAQQHDLRAIGLEKSIVESLMKEHFGELDMLNMPKEQRDEVNRCFLEDVHQKMEENGLVDMISEDPDDRRVMSHVDPELTPLNEFLIDKPLEIYLEEELKPIVKEKTGRGMQEICTPFKEDVLVTNKNTTMDDVVRYSKAIKEEFGWTPVQIYIHHDEGHFDKQTGEWKENFHAHIIFDTINHDTGKTIQMNRADMSNRQTIAAEALGMERGENSGDIAHMASIQFKEEQIKADSRFEVSMSVKKVGLDPTALMVDEIKRKIEEVGSSKRSQEPNQRTMINLLRPIGKTFDLNPTRLCADAIYAGLQRNPDKMEYVANQLGVKTSVKDVEKSSDVLDKEVKEAIYKKAVWCGKVNEDAKSFRPLLHCAKELGVDLVPVMKEPIMKKLEEIPSLPISIESNNQLWCAIESYDKGKPMEMLQDAQTEGLDKIESQAQEAEKVYADIEDKISDTLEVVGSSKADVLKDGIHRFVREITERGATKSDVIEIAKISSEIGLRPSETIVDNLMSRMPEEDRPIACRRFSLPQDTSKETVCQTASVLAKRYDDGKDYSLNNIFVGLYKAPDGFKCLAGNLLKHVDAIAEMAKTDAKMMEVLEVVADQCNVDSKQGMKLAIDNGVQTIKERAEVAFVEGISNSLDTAGVSKEETIKNGIHRIVDDVVKQPNESIDRTTSLNLCKACEILDLRPSEIVAERLVRWLPRADEKQMGNVCKKYGIPIGTDVKTVGEGILKAAKISDDNKDFSSITLISPGAGYVSKLLAPVVLGKLDALVNEAGENPAAIEKLENVAKLFGLDEGKVVKMTMESVLEKIDPDKAESCKDKDLFEVIEMTEEAVEKSVSAIGGVSKLEEENKTLKRTLASFAMEHIPAIKTLYEAGLKSNDDIVDLMQGKTVTFVGKLSYNNVIIESTRGFKLSIKEGNPSPFVNGKDIKDYWQETIKWNNEQKQSRGPKL